MTSLVFQHPERLWLVWVSLGIAVVILAIGYHRSPLRGPSRWLAPACKVAACALLVLCIADPVWSRKQPRTGENEVVVVADNSASLAVAEKPGETTRAARMKRALGEDPAVPPAWLEELSRMFRVKTQTVDERLQNVADFSKLDFKGGESGLNKALATLRSSGPGSRLAAVVLVTDGNPTDKDSVSEMTPGVPVYPVLVGDGVPQPDLRIAQWSVTQTAFEDTPVTITAHVAGTGLQGKDAVVCVLDEKGKVSVSEKVRISGEDVLQTERLKVPAVKPGVSFYRLAIMDAGLANQAESGEWKKLAAEAVLENNERHISIDRGAGPYRILYVSGRPNWEYKFLRRALAGDPEVQMPSLIRIAKREPKFEWRGRTGETSNPLFRGFGQQAEAQRYDQPVLIRLGTRDAGELADGFPKSAEQLFGEYRAVIIDDLEAEFFSQEQMNLLERFVSERGGALLMLGGQECYQAGKYEHTPLGRMLPVYLDRIGQGAALTEGRFNLTREGWLEPWTRLRPDREADEQRLAQMPTFHAINRVFSIKPGASVLATVGDEGNSSTPALAAHRFGEGRVAAVTVADLWRWGMKDEAAGKDQERAWRQLMRWLVVDVPDRVQFAATSEGSHVRLEVRAKTAAFAPLDDAIVKMEVEDPSGKKSTLYAEPSLKEAGLFEAEFFSSLPGPYRAKAIVEPAAREAGAPGEQRAEKATGWVHDPLATEFASVRPGREWMQRLAAESGGEMLGLEDLNRLPELLKNIRVPVEETVTSPVWHTPWFFAAVLGLLGTEWLLRRKGGMA